MLVPHLAQFVGAFGFVALVIMRALGQDVDPLLMAGSLSLLAGGTVQDAVKGLRQ